MARIVAAVVVVVVAAILAPACGRSSPVVWQCTFGSKNGVAHLETDRFSIAFEGVPIVLRPEHVSGGSGGSLQVGGGGAASNTLTVRDVSMTSAYRSGVNAITVGRYSVEIEESGGKLRIGDAVFPLGAEKKRTIAIDEAGVARER